MPQVTFDSSPARMPTRLCSEQLMLPPLDAMGPVEYLNSTKEQIPLTPIELNKANSPTKFQPFSLSSDEGQFGSAIEIMSPERLLDVKVSRMQSMPLGLTQSKLALVLAQAPEKLEAEEMDQADEA